MIGGLVCLLLPNMVALNDDFRHRHSVVKTHPGGRPWLTSLAPYSFKIASATLMPSTAAEMIPPA